MSHHLDTPLAAQTGQLYIDDLYVFPSETGTVFVMDVNSNVNGLHSEPGFHPEARYEFKVHFDGAEFETLTYRVSFDEADPEGQQGFQLDALTGDQARDDSAPGELVLEGRTGEVATAAARQQLPLRRPCLTRAPKRNSPWPIGEVQSCFGYRRGPGAVHG